MVKRTVLLVIVFIVLLSGCSTSSSYSLTKPVGEISNPELLALSYDNFNGKKFGDFYPLVEGEIVEFHVVVETISGSLTVLVTLDDDSDENVYIAEDIPTSEFYFTIDEPGEYELYLVGENHKGGYSISNTRTFSP